MVKTGQGGNEQGNASNLFVNNTPVKSILIRKKGFKVELF